LLLKHSDADIPSLKQPDAISRDEWRLYPVTIDERAQTSLSHLFDRDHAPLGRDVIEPFKT
jgi:hypothetical protein